jgi:hypothetical protein
MADNKSIVGGIFGLTPDLYQQQRLADLQAQQVKAATMAAGPGTMLNPSLAPLYAQAAQQGQLIGEGARAIGGLLGVEDPQLRMVRDVTEMRKQFDVSTPQGLRQFAQALGQKGYTDLAMQAGAEADKRELTQAQTVRALREPGMQSFEKLVSSGKYTPQSLAKYQQSGNVGDLQLVKGAAGEGGAEGAGPVGKSGAWRDADGIVYSASEMQKQRAGFQQGEKLLENLNAITPSDVKNSESWVDWTQGENRKQIGGKVATKTVAAQAKVNAAQLLKQIESLPPGSASNADMIAAKSSFPGYGDATALQAWIDDTKTKLQNSLSRQADQYGFKQRVPSVAPTSPTPSKPGSSRENPIKL